MPAHNVLRASHPLHPLNADAITDSFVEEVFKILCSLRILNAMAGQGTMDSVTSYESYLDP